MKITRSSKLSLKFITQNKRDKLSEFMREYGSVVNQYVQIFWKNTPDNHTELIKDLLDLVADTWLSARAKQVAAREALNMINLAKSSKSKMPIHKGRTVLATSNIAEIQVGRNSFDLWLKIYSIGRKIVIYIPLKNHRHNLKYQDWKRCSTLVISNNSVKISYQNITESKKNVGIVMGLDLGLNVLAVTDDGQHYGNGIRALIEKLFRKKRCSKAWYRCLAEIKAYINVTLKKLPWDQLRLLVVENLKNMKKGMKKFRRRLNSNIRRVLTHWNYRYILERIESFCQLNRVSFRSTSPFNTSITCSRCNHCEKGNRVSRDIFVCRNCGYTADADANAAKTILNRFLTGRYGACFQA